MGRHGRRNRKKLRNNLRKMGRLAQVLEGLGCKTVHELADKMREEPDKGHQQPAQTTMHSTWREQELKLREELECPPDATLWFHRPLTGVQASYSKPSTAAYVKKPSAVSNYTQRSYKAPDAYKAPTSAPPFKNQPAYQQPEMWMDGQGHYHFGGIEPKVAGRKIHDDLDENPDLGWERQMDEDDYRLEQRELNRHPQECPYCYNKMWISRDTQGHAPRYQVRCGYDGCGIRGPFQRTPSDALKQWELLIKFDPDEHQS